MPQPQVCLWLFATLRKGLETSAAKQTKDKWFVYFFFKFFFFENYTLQL